MLQPGRQYNTSPYRYGFNGKEKENEIKGEGNQLDYGFRIYDQRPGRFLSIDPLTKKYPWYTPYQFAGNKPIWANDLDGAEEEYKTIVSQNIQQAKLQIQREEYNKLNPSGSFKVPSVSLGEKLDNFFNGPQNQFNTNPNFVVGKLLFDLADDIKVTTTSFTSNGSNARHINPWRGKASFEERMGSFINVSTTFLGGAIGAEARAINSSLTRASIDDKLARYLLNLEHPSGNTKAKWFQEALGFTKDNADELAKQIKFDPNKAIFQRNNGYSDLYQQTIPIKGVNGKTINVPLNWEVRKGENFSRLVGAIPVKPK